MRRLVWLHSKIASP